jgi:hypothetical protein
LPAVLALHIAAESSKVPFYIAGLLLAGWAVVLSVFGITRPAFPTGPSGQRGVILISAVLVVVAVAMAIVTA